MEKMIENGQNSVATSANEKVVRYVNNNHCKGTKATYKVESHKYASDTHSVHSVWVDYYYNINQLNACFHHNDYMDAEKFYVKDGRNWVEFNYDYDTETEMVDNEVITEAVPAEEKNYYFDCATNFYERGVVYNVLNAENLYNWFKKSKNKLTIAIKEANGFIGVIYKADDGWWIKMLNSLAAGDLIEERYYIGKRITKNSFNDIVMWINAYVSDIWATPTEDNAEAVPAEAEAEKVDNEVITEAEDNNVYFTYNDIYEALNTILNAKSSKVQVELHEISDITDVPKSMCFFRQSSGNIGINFINHCDADDPLAECYDFAEDYLRENASDIAFELSYRPFNDDPHPQTEDITEAVPAESNNDLVEKVVEIVKKIKDGREILVSKEVCQKNGIDVSSWPVFAANLTKNSDNNYVVKVYIYNNAYEILAKFNHDTGSKRWGEAVGYDVANYIVDIMTAQTEDNAEAVPAEDFYFKTEEYKKAEAEAVKALPF